MHLRGGLLRQRCWNLHAGGHQQDTGHLQARDRRPASTERAAWLAMQRQVRLCVKSGRFAAMLRRTWRAMGFYEALVKRRRQRLRWCPLRAGKAYATRCQLSGKLGRLGKLIRPLLGSWPRLAGWIWSCAELKCHQSATKTLEYVPGCQNFETGPGVTNTWAAPRGSRRRSGEEDGDDSGWVLSLRNVQRLGRARRVVLLGKHRVATGVCRVHLIYRQRLPPLRPAWRLLAA